jgi:thiol:disulfide interchange protein DsbD
MASDKVHVFNDLNFEQEVLKSTVPVLVDFTATWCPTCNIAVKPAFEKEVVQKKLKEVGAVALVADYSRQPQYITDELNRFGRSAVPFVLVYPRDPNSPPMTFDWVTKDTIVEALDRAVRGPSPN